VALAACSLGAPAGPAVDVSPALPERTPPAPSSEARTDPSPAPPHPASTPRPGAHPAGSRYAAGAHGYDLSYPQCASGEAAPAGAQFGIVGVNGGKAFSRNSCLYVQWGQLASPRSIYLNSGYNPDNYDLFPVPTCRDVAAKLAQVTDVQRSAYAIGCAEAEFSYVVMGQDGISRPDVCWVDVESANSWDEVDLNLNRFALQGLFDQLAGHGCPIGIYASFKEWRQITGGWRPAAVSGDWVSNAVPLEACGGRGFTGAPVWLVQELATWPDVPVDSDWAC
jgi:hypothetical protein